MRLQNQTTDAARRADQKLQRGCTFAARVRRELLWEKAVIIRYWEPQKSFSRAWLASACVSAEYWRYFSRIGTVDTTVGGWMHMHHLDGRRNMVTGLHGRKQRGCRAVSGLLVSQSTQSLCLVGSADGAVGVPNTRCLDRALGKPSRFTAGGNACVVDRLREKPHKQMALLVGI